ncbi:3-oxoacyl-[acyl-carrier protein] reductase [Desulfatibacillum alkenivorans DSM 16219]|jgi:NAD(P)-dependent dehydrogenase (short-subunit alcohol dehydrogenase family)|uniref:3-oxoacyl-[acyl-carrier protein] reductase n=1 Tax=Desulfatibacillum alkenivorans DSM 16219 TaxID=1121393 RepID=A0A1M6LU47_9BACT|nr:SDR family NAD(P)-dependent oxidoreductase [Desulfatibacillum alkenivorans]SHJ74724.1 3-oxoacyl-[acyl-carrier protein] reductase [Desulfatibacillum alkenivorans DSM 16219]
MYDDLKGQVALITGAGKTTGIGYAIAEKMAACGADVVITDLGGPGPRESEQAPPTTDEMNETAAGLAAKYGVKVIAVEMDVTDTESVNKMAEVVKTEFGRMDALFNNAGASFGVPSTIHDYDEGAWLRTIDVNLHGVYRVSKALAPLLRENKGRIVNVASRAGKFPALFNGAYSVAKAGVIMLSKVMAKELGGEGVRVNAICPGQIMTDLQRWRLNLEAQVFQTTFEDRKAEMCKTIPLGYIAEPEEVASLAVYLVSKESSYLTGQAINVTGGQLMEL